MLVLRGLFSVSRRGLAINLIYKTPYYRMLTNLHHHRQKPIKLLTIGWNYSEKIKILKCGFHTTQRLCIPPVFALLIRPLTRIGALLFGRLFKRWWKKRTPEEKEKYTRWFTARKRKFYGVLGFLLAGFFGVYIFHLETDPLTGRTRFIILNEEQQNSLGKLTLEAHMTLHMNSIIPTNHPSYRRLVSITDRILEANADLPQVKKRKWSLTVVDSDMKNAFVLPSGNIFVFSGALNMVENDDQLACVLAHEIAHVLLLHPIEQVSRNILLDILLVVPIALIWAMFPDILAILLQVLGINIANILLTLPYSRKLENEADDVGLKLAAKACFDVRQGVVFWELMQLLTELNFQPKAIPWLSTHPNHEDRAKNLSTKLSDALTLRTKNKCPRLNPANPIEYFHSLSLNQREQRLKAYGML